MAPPFLPSPSPIEKNLKLAPHSPEWKLLSQMTAVRCGIIDPDECRALQFELNQLFEEVNGLKNPPLSANCVPKTLECEHAYDNRLKFWDKMVKERKRLSRRIQEKTGKSEQDVLFNRALIDEQERCIVKQIMDCSDDINTEKDYPTSKSSHNHHQKSRLTLETKQEIKVPPEYEENCTKSISTCEKKSRDRVKRKCKQLKGTVCKKVRKMTKVKTMKKVEKKVKENTKKITKEIAKPEEDVVKKQELEILNTYKELELSDRKFKVSKPKKMQKLIVTGIKINSKVFNIGKRGQIPHVELEEHFECFAHQQVKKRILHLENIGLNTLTLSLKKQNFFPEGSCLQCCRHNKILTDPILFCLEPGDKRNINIVYQPRKVGVFKQRWILKVCTNKYMYKSGEMILKICGSCKPNEEMLNSSFVSKENLMGNVCTC